MPSPIARLTLRRTISVAASVLLLSATISGCGGGKSTANPSPQPSLIQPTIVRPTPSDGLSAADLPLTAAWQQQVANFVANYPKAASAQQSQALSAAYADTTNITLTCDETLTWKCTLGAPTAGRTWLVMSDGAAGQWLPAFAAAVEQQRGLRVLVFSVPGCQNSLDDAGLLAVNENQFTKQNSIDCAAMHAAATALVARQRVEAAVLIDRAILIGGEREKSYAVGLRNMVQALGKHTKVNVMGALPSWSVAPATCFNKSLDNLTSCYGSALANARTMSYLQNVVMSGNGTFIDPRTWLCARNICPLFVLDNIVTIDGSQLATAMAAALAPVLYENIATPKKS